MRKIVLQGSKATMSVNFKDNKSLLNSAPLVPTLKIRKEFLAIRSGKRHVTQNFNMQVKFIKDPEKQQGLRVGYTVTKKVGNAVVRNRIRRRLKHAFAQAVALKGDKAKKVNADLILVAKKQVITTSFENLVIELTKGIDRLLSTGKKAV